MSSSDHEEVNVQSTVAHRLDSEGVVSWEPQIGMEFDSLDEAHKFYNHYSSKIGFSVRIRGTKKKNDVVCNRIYCCSKEGYRASDTRDESVINPRAETRCGCKAHLSLKRLADGRYKILNFKPDHNHDVVTPRKVQILRSHRRLSESQATEADLASCSEMAPPKVMIEFMGRQTGGQENRFKSLCPMLIQVASKASLSEEASTFVAEYTIKMMKEVDEITKKIHINNPVEASKGGDNQNVEPENLDEEQYDADNLVNTDAVAKGIKPKKKTGGGRKRFLSALEKATNAGRKKLDFKRTNKKASTSTNDNTTTSASHSQSQVVYQQNVMPPPNVRPSVPHHLPQVAYQVGPMPLSTFTPNVQWLPFTNQPSVAPQMHHFMHPTSMPHLNIETASHFESNQL